MAVTQNTYTGDGTTVLFSFTFPYLETTDIKVSLDGSVTTAYTLANATTIQFNTAPDAGVAIRIYRQTEDSALSAQFYPGSAIRASDLNDNFTQNLYVTQEVNDNAFRTDGANPMVGDLNMGGFEVINLGDPTSDGAAATKAYVDVRGGNADIPGYTRWTYNATGGETTLSGIGFTGGTLQYSATREQVFLNGALLQRGVDYTADNDTSITLLSGPLLAGDLVDVRCVNNLVAGVSSTTDDITYPPQFTGAVTRTASEKLKDIVSVKDFGAVGDEVTDDTSAIQAAFDYAAQTNKAVYFPAGKYLVSQIVVNKSVSFFGDGRASTRIRSSDNTLNLFTYEMGYEDRYPFFIRDLTLFGGKYQLLAHNATPADIRNCSFLRPIEASIRGGWNAYHWTVEGCEFKGGRYNIMFAGTGTGATANENVVLDNGTTSGVSGQLSSLIGNWYVEAEQAAIRLNTAEGLNIIGGYLELCAANDSGGNPAWAATTPVDVGDVANINSGAAYGYVYRCTTAGTTGGSVPTNTTENASVTDGTVTWEVLGPRAGVLVTNNRGFRMTHMQGERNAGTPWVILNGTSTYYYSTIIANNSIRQTAPAPGIVINDEKRVIVTGNHFINNGPWLSIPSTSTVEGLIATGNIYENDMSATGTLNEYTLSGNIRQNASDEFTVATNYTPGYNQAVDRYVEAQYLGDPDTSITKTYTLASTFDASAIGYVGTYEVQVGQYVTAASTYGLSTYELNVTKGPNGINTTFTKVSGNLNVTFAATTNTTTQYSGGFTAGPAQGVLIRVIRKTPLTGRAALTTLTHTIS